MMNEMNQVTYHHVSESADGYSLLAMQRDACMLASPEAQRAYQQIYGVEWRPYCEPEVASYVPGLDEALDELSSMVARTVGGGL